MSYIKEFEQQLAEKLARSEETTSIVSWVSEKVLESYKNGITAGQKMRRSNGSTEKAE